MYKNIWIEKCNPNRKLTYKYCCDCGRENNPPSTYRNCKDCCKKVNAGVRFEICQRCKKAKKYDNWGLCNKCKEEIERLNQEV